MAVSALFSGNALRSVDARGRTTLPPFVLRTLERRGGGPRVLFGAHESDPCINGYDEAYGAALLEEVERRRLREEAEGVPPDAHHSRSRRLFGAVEVSDIDSHGQITLPPMSRRRGRIRDQALFVGTGGSFEVWDPDVALGAGDEDLRELVEFALAGDASRQSEETE